jgi:hypothetical protein
MRLIVDTNQVDRLCEIIERNPCVLSPYELVLGLPVLCELLKPPFRPEKLRALSQCRWRFAKEMFHFLELELNGRPTQIANFNALYESTSKIHLRIEQIMSNPSPIAIENSTSILANMIAVARQSSESFLALPSPSREIRIDGYEDLKNAALGCLVERLPQQDRNRTAKKLCAVMNNDYFRHFIMSNTAHQYAQMGLWSIPELNRTFQRNMSNDRRANDYIDMMLVAHAKVGDIVLTADSHLASMGNLASNGEVKLMTVTDFLQK